MSGWPQSYGIKEGGMNCLGGKDTKLLKICITATDELVKDN